MRVLLHLLYLGMLLYTGYPKVFLMVNSHIIRYTYHT